MQEEENDRLRAEVVQVGLLRDELLSRCESTKILVEERSAAFGKIASLEAEIEERIKEDGAEHANLSNSADLLETELRTARETLSTRRSSPRCGAA